MARGYLCYSPVPLFMPYCPDCGEEVAEEITFCPECGGNIHQDNRDTVEPTSSGAGESAKITDLSAFSKGSLGLQVVFTVLTLGLYTMYWTYKTAKALDKGTDQDLTPILGVIPLANIIAFWQISEASEPFTDKDPMTVFLLFIFFGIISWYWVQSGINAVASQQ